MIKTGKLWVGENPTEQLKLERMRALRRKAYKIQTTIEDGNKTLLENY